VVILETKVSELKLVRELQYKVMRLQRMCPVATGFRRPLVSCTDTKLYSFMGYPSDKSPVITVNVP
jgi:hypothetical protein